MAETTKVQFYEHIQDELLQFAVILSKSQDNYVFCKHKDRDTAILDTARRELYEETGALDFELTPICIYSVTAPDNFDGKESFGMLYFADIKRFDTELHHEIEKIIITSQLPTRWTYPDIQPKLLEKASLHL